MCNMNHGVIVYCTSVTLLLFSVYILCTCMQVSSGLGEGKGMEKEMKSIPEFPIVARLYKLKQ